MSQQPFRSDQFSIIGIHFDVTDIDSCLNTMSDHFAKVKLSADIRNELESLINRSKKWFLGLTPGKRNCSFLIVSANNALADAKLQQSDSVRMLRQFFFAGMKWKDYTESIARSTARQIGSLCRSKQFSSAECILHISYIF